MAKAKVMCQRRNWLPTYVNCSRYGVLFVCSPFGALPTQSPSPSLRQEIDVNGDEVMEWDEFTSFIVDKAVVFRDDTSVDAIAEYHAVHIAPDEGRNRDTLESRYAEVCAEQSPPTKQQHLKARC